MLQEDQTQDHIHTFSSSNVLVEVKFKESCSFSVSRDFMFSVDFSLTYKLFQHNSLFKVTSSQFLLQGEKSHRFAEKMFVSLSC